MKRRLPDLKIPLFIIGAMICAFYLCIGAGAQTEKDATLAGGVTDASGRPISGARIEVTQIIAKQIRGGRQAVPAAVETVSHDDGSFSIALEPGTYRIAITREKFTRVEHEAVLTAGQKVEWTIRMEIEPLAAGVVVTAQATPIETESTPAPVTTITREQIEQRQANSLPGLLETLPGFSLSQNGPEGGLASLFLDGGNSNFTKVLVDGAPVNDSGGVMDFSNLTLDNIEKIEVVHGAESALYGSDAMTGVVQIFTKRGTTRTPELEMVGDGGSFDTGHGSSTVSGLLGALDYSGGFGYFTTAGQGTNDFMLNRTYSGNFGWKFSDNDTVRVSIRNNDSDAGIPGQTLLFFPDATQTNDLHDLSASVIWNAQAGTHWQWRVSANEADQHTNDNDPAEFFDSISQFNRAGGDAQGTYLFKNGAATAGYSYEVENGFPGAINGQHARRNNQAGYVDARWQPTKRLTLNAGARAEDNSSFGTRVVPRVGASYLVTQGGGNFGDTRLHAFYGEGIVEPALDQSFGMDPCFPGNPALQPEQSITANGGIDQTMFQGRLHLSADYFYNQFHDIISFGLGPTTSGCPFGTGTYFNTDKAVARGINFSGELRPARWMRVAGNYSYDDSRVLDAPNASDPNEVAGNHLLRRPVNSGTLEMNFTARRLNVNLLGYFSGKRTDSLFTFPPTTQPNPGYARFDAGASYHVRREVSLFVRAANLLNKQYQDALGFPALGREIIGGVKLTFGGD